MEVAFRTFKGKLDFLLRLSMYNWDEDMFAVLIYVPTAESADNYTNIYVQSSFFSINGS